MAANCHSGENNDPRPKVAVVMVPLPAQGHLNQLLHLSRLIAAYNIPVHYVSTATHNHQAKLRAHCWDPLSSANLHFHEIPVPKFQSPTPNPKAANKFPSHLQPLFNAATTHLRHPVAALIRSLSHTSHRVVVIHDSLMASVVRDVASISNAESYIFHSVSAFAMFLYFWEGMQKPFLVEDEYELLNQVPSLEDCFTPEFMEFLVSEHKYMSLSSGSLYNSCRAVEGKFMDLIQKLAQDKNRKHWAIGPFNPVELLENKPKPHECLQWLDKQEKESVIFVSFGTTTSLPDQQIKELATGLEESGLKFVWVLRDADKGDPDSADTEITRKVNVPSGFEERVRERGIVVRDWAPQLEILAHFATGGFLTHCGWNSCMESISMGVPIGAWPMHSDQPRNAVLMTQVLRIGVVVKDWDERDKIVGSATIAGAVKRLMGSEEGEEMRRRAEQLGGAVRSAVAEGGVTRLEMDYFIAHIGR